MPAHEAWLEDEIIQTTWTKPLTSDDLLQCFLGLAEKISNTAKPVHILFDITHSGPIPVDAPLFAIRSRFMTKSNTGRIAVIGTNALPKMLADVAARHP